MAKTGGSGADAGRGAGGGEPAGGFDPSAPTGPEGPAPTERDGASLVGLWIHRYEIESRLGEGTFGEVYRARDTLLRRDVALKTLRSRWTRDGASLARFRREAEVLARISHPNVASVYDILEQGGGVFIVMEFVEGETLAHRLREGRLGVRESAAISLQIARGLGAAHDRGIVHRDLKPSNVMLGCDVVKVLDFGLAKLAVPGGGDGGAGGRGVLGTPGYMSPEQAAGGEIDHRADVWAFGCVLYECLTGVRAFAHEGAALDLSVLPAGTPAVVRSLIEWCLESEVARRPALMSEVAGALGEAVRGGESRGVPARPPLPLETDTLVGREREGMEVRRLLGESRLVTVLGPGGCGKTRLALRVAREAQGGGAWVGAAWLASLSDPVQAPRLIAEALGARSPGRGVDAVVEAVGDGAALLVLDNCEHVLASVASFVREALARAPGLRVLGTSREPLRVPGERVYRLGGLSAPQSVVAGASAVDLERYEAVRLFVDRARASDDGFRLSAESAGHVARICAGVDGLPLAIELAAARVGSLPLAEIADRLGDAPRLLRRGGGSGGRHDTLGAAMDWSYSSLTADEQALFLGLSVFSGGCTLDAAVEVCGAGGDEFAVIDLVARLVDKSLLAFDSETGRYRMLGPVLAYARGRARAEADWDALRRRHAGHFVETGERWFLDHGGPNEALALDRFQRDHDNFLSALECLIGEGGDAGAGVRLANVLVLFWQTRGYVRLGLDWFERLIASRGGVADSIQARAYNAAAILAWSEGDRARARSLIDSSIAIASALGEDARLARCHSLLGILHTEGGELRAAREAHARAHALYRASGDRVREAQESLNLAVVTIHEGDPDEAESLLRVCLPAFREAGDRFREAAALRNLAGIAMSRGDAAGAFEFLADAWHIRRAMGHLAGCASIALLLGVCAARQGRVDGAREFAVVSEKLRGVAGAPRVGDEVRLWAEVCGETGLAEELSLAPGDSPDTLLERVDRCLESVDGARSAGGRNGERA